MRALSRIRNRSKGCFLSQNRGISLAAVAFSTYLLVGAIVKAFEPSSVPIHRPAFFVLGPIVGVWLLATLAYRCSLSRERMFYILWMGYFVVVAIRTCVPLSSHVIRASNFVQMAIGSAALTLSVLVASRHFLERSASVDGS